MASERVELARRAYEDFRRHDLDAFLAGIAEDVEFLPLMREAEGQAVYHGHEGVRRYYASVFDTFPDYAASAEDILELDDALVVETRVTGTGAVSGLRLDERVWATIKDRGGLVYWWGFFRTREEAFAVVERPRG
jgi:ketosteroid isomerase-like protein